MIKNVLKIWIGVIIFAISSSSVFAVNIELVAPKKEFSVNDQFEVNFKVNTQGEDINGMYGAVDFSSDIFSVVEIRTGNSIVGKWIKKPVISDLALKFAYIVPNGYKGVLSPYYGGYKPGKMFSVVFSAKKTGSGYIKISSGGTYLNDGKATKTDMFSNTLYVNVSDSDNVVASENLSSDVSSPDQFEISISKDESIFDEKWFLVFDAKDNGDGIDHYEIYESRSNGYSKKGWIVAESPYVLEDQNLSSYVYVKAVDGNGNETIETFEPSKMVAWYNYFSFWGAIVLGLIVVAVIVKKARI